MSIKSISEGGRGPKELTGMVDLSLHPNNRGKLVVKVRLLDLVPGRTGETYMTWLKDRGDTESPRVRWRLWPAPGYTESDGVDS